MEAETATLISAVERAPATAAWRGHVLRAAGWSLCALTLYALPMILSRPLFETPEARIAVVAREMIERDNYIEPTLAGKTRLNKPPLPYWLAVLTAKYVAASTPSAPPSEDTLRYAVLIPQALSGALAVFIVCLYGSIVFGAAAGTYAALILGFSMMPAKFAQLGYPDTALMLGFAGTACAASWMACSPRPGVMSALALGVSVAWAFLIKEPIVALLLPAPVAIECCIGLYRRKFSGRKIVLFLLAGLVAAALIAPWYYLVYKTVPNGWDRIVSERMSIWVKGHDDKPLKYYAEHLAGGLLPWTPLMLIAWILGRTKPEQPSPESLDRAAFFRFLGFMALLAFIGFYSRAKKQEYYLLPLFPALALASGHAIACCRTVRGHVEESIAWLHVAVGLLGAAALAYLPFQKYHDIPVALGIGVGAIFLVLFLIAARYWAEGRIHASGIVAGLAAFLALLPVSQMLVARGERKMAIDAIPGLQPRGSLLAEAPRLRAELDALGKDVVIYEWGNALPLMNYLLGRPINGPKDLQEAIESRNAAGPRRVVVATPESLRRANLQRLLPQGGAAHPMLALPLPQDIEVAEYFKFPEHEPIDPPDDD